MPDKHQLPSWYVGIRSRCEQLKEPVQSMLDLLEDIRSAEALDEQARSQRTAALFKSENVTCASLEARGQEVTEMRTGFEERCANLDPLEREALRSELGALRSKLVDLQMQVNLLHFQHPDEQQRLQKRLGRLSDQKQRPIRQSSMQLGREITKAAVQKATKKAWSLNPEDIGRTDKRASGHCPGRKRTKGGP